MGREVEEGGGGMSQSKKHSHYEIIVNSVLGIAIGWSIVFFIFPLLEKLTRMELASVSSMIFFAASYIRAYVVRRAFNSAYVLKRLG